MATRKRPAGGIVTFLAAVSALCCSPNNRLVSRRHAWGVNTVVEATPGRKLVDATWKGDDLWILTRPAGEGEKLDQEWMLDEYSTWGALNNHILLKEIPK